LTFAATATAQLPVIFLVRHAERAATSGRVPSDTGLSRVGETRAQHLAEELKDANITAIYTTEYKRTKETAMPLTRLAGIRPEVVAADDLRALTSKLKQASGNVLVVGHSNTLPQIINALGVGTRVAVSESDYDNLFVIVHEPEARLIHLHYR
jgi:broad specificity phosphatase PhoE